MFWYATAMAAPIQQLMLLNTKGDIMKKMCIRDRVHGGMSMGLGFGLSEELLVDEKTGRPLNNNLLDLSLIHI